MGVVSYKLALPSYVNIHDVFHVSFLHKYVPNTNHVLYFDAISLKDMGEFLTKPLMIVSTKQKQLCKKVIY